MNEFNNLLERYLNHIATPEENARLFELIRTGQYDERMGDDLLDALVAELGTETSPEERAGLDDLYKSRIQQDIHAEQNIAEESQEIWPAPLSGNRWMAAALLLIALGLWWYGLGSRQAVAPPPASAHNSMSADTSGLLSRYAGKQLVHLPDGSTVLLNENSELIIDPGTFGIDNRDVQLKGEGFFDVRPDPSRVFRVRAGEVLTTVLGTAFNVRCVPGSNEVKVTVTRGKVKVSDSRRTYDLLSPDQEITVNTDSYHFVKKAVDSELATEWKDRFLILDNVTIEEAVQLIGTKFQVKLVMAHAALGGCHISASFFNGENLEHVLKVISTVNRMSYSRLPDGSVLLDGTGECE